MIFDDNIDGSFEREANFFQKVDRILSGEIKIKVNARISEELAWANIKEKSINLSLKRIFNEVNKDKLRFITISKGLNYHELSHLLNTKLFEKKLTQDLLREEFEIINSLEDGRIETIFSNKYPRTKKYFINCFHQIIHNYSKHSPAQNPLVFLSSQSRRLFLDKKSLYTYEAIFNKTYGDEITTKIKFLIDEYLTSKNPNYQLEIAKKIFEIIRKKTPQMGIPQLSNQSSIKGETNQEYDEEDQQNIEEIINQTKNNPPTTKIDDLTKNIIDKINEQNKIQEKILEQEKKSRNNSKKAGEKRKEITKNNNDLGNLKKLLEQEKNKTKELQDQKKIDELNKKIKENNEEYKKLNAQRDNYDKKSSSENNKKYSLLTKKGVSEKELNKEIIKTINENNNEYEESISESEEETLNDVESIYQENTIGSGAGSGKSNDENENTTPFIPADHHKLIAKKLSVTLRKIQNDKRKGYIEHQSIGKINIGRAMNFPKTADPKIFNKYEPDKNKQTRIGVIILIDRSGSMTGVAYNQAFETAWTIDKAVTETGNKTIIIEFNQHHRVIKNFEDNKGNWNKRSGGDTDPTSALETAYILMNKANKRHKIKNWILYILTDGDWMNGSRRHEEIIKTFNKKEVETNLIFLTGGYELKPEQVPSHHCKNKNVIKTIYELEPLLQKSIKENAMKIRNKQRS